MKRCDKPLVCLDNRLSNSSGDCCHYVLGREMGTIQNLLRQVEGLTEFLAPSGFRRRLLEIGMIEELLQETIEHFPFRRAGPVPVQLLLTSGEQAHGAVDRHVARAGIKRKDILQFWS